MSPSPQEAPCPAPRRVPIWLSIELVVDDGDKVTHYAIEGHPDTDSISPEQFKIEPEYDEHPALPHLHALLMTMNLRLKDVTMMATNDPPAGSVKRRRASGLLRAVD